MAIRTHHIRGAHLAALAAGVLLAAGTATTAVAQDPLPVGPNLYFNGLVNGSTTNAPIQVGCFGPITPGETGHPLAGQYVEADTTIPSSTTTGYTGTAAHSLQVTLTSATGSSIATIGTLSAFYLRLPIPTTLSLPCTGTAQVRFTPQPTSPTARPATVQVNLLSQP